MDLFDSLWYVIVTFSTVGYGDLVPDIWLSKLFMMCLIGAIFIVLPSQVRISEYSRKLSDSLGLYDISLTLKVSPMLTHLCHYKISQGEKV